MQAAVAQPATAEEVSAVVKFATANGIAFNVKGGGHSTAAMSAAPSPEGMVLDLGLMNSVSVDPASQTVTFGGGCIWRQVDAALWEHGLATPGGAVSSTGVGGLILHGGFGLLSGLHGLTLDVLISCQVVLADGSIVTASKTENQELFWALRGAGSSFGVVTSFTSKAFPQGEVWAGVVLYYLDKMDVLLDFLNHWEETNDGSQVVAMVFTHLPQLPGVEVHGPPPPVVGMQIVHTGSNAAKDGPEYFAPILDVESVFQNVGPMPYPVMNQVGDMFAPPGRRYQFGGANFTLPMQLSTLEALRDIAYGLNKAYPHAGAQDSSMVIEGIPNKQIRSVGLDEMSFNNRGSYYNLLLNWQWKDEGIDQAVRQYNRKAQVDVRKFGYDDAQLRDGVGVYANYAASGDALKAETVFGSNTERLLELKQKYDHENVFDKLWKLVGKPEQQP